MKILLTGGGSGGHVSPALAVAAHYHNPPHSSVLYFGSSTGPEKNLAQKNSLPFYPISTGKLRRYFSLQNFLDPFRLLRGIFQSYFLLRRHRPNLVFATGGFVSLPVCFAAFLRRVPIILLEADSVPGLSNKILSRLARHICLAFPSSSSHLPHKKTHLTGLPLLSHLTKGSVTQARKITKFNPSKPVLLVLGGSQGAHFLNQQISELLPSLTKICSIIHLTGPGKPSPHPRSKSYYPLEYTDPQTLSHFYSLADLALTRAGANTLFELAANSIPALIIPLPSAASDHQTKNARYFSSHHTALLRTQSSLKSPTLLQDLRSLLTSPSRLKKMKKAYTSLPTHNSLQRITSLIDRTISNS